MSALNSRPAQVTAVMHQESKVYAAETVEDIRLRSFMKACSKDEVLLVVNLGTLSCIEYSSTMVIPVKKRIIKRVQPAKIYCLCLCQALVANLENDLLKIPLEYV